jgi:hypothetical protein
MQLSAAELAALNAGNSVTMLSPVITQPTPPTPPPASPGSGAVYANGNFYWPGDWSGSNTTLNYKDTVGNAPNEDLSFTSNGPWAYWLPYAPLVGGNPQINLAPFHALQMSLKPTKPNQKWSVNLYKAGDVMIGTISDISVYGSAPVVGQWGVYTVPLSVLNGMGITAEKFLLQDQTGLTGNIFYINNVAFI